MTIRTTFKSALLSTALIAASLVGYSTSASAEDLNAMSYHGITLYGAVDVGVAYQSKGTTLDPYYGPGLDYQIGKYSNRSIFSVAPNGMTQSYIGIKGNEALVDGFSAIFAAEIAFNPTSGNVADGVKSMVLNASRPVNQQTSGQVSDSGYQGQLFRVAYVGVQSPLYGTLTFGRQNTVLNDDISAYDPVGGYAFSLFGYSGITAGAGATNMTRVSNQIKYTVTQGPVHAGLSYQGSNDSGFGSLYEGDVGATYAGFSIDALYSKINDAYSAALVNSPTAAGSSILSATTTCKTFTSCTTTLTNTAALKATVSDNTATTINAKYVYGPLTTFAGYEHITYQNPSFVPSAGFTYGSGYNISTITTNAYSSAKYLNVIWFGEKYQINDKMDVSVGWYHIEQHAYSSTASTASSCGTAKATASGAIRDNPNCAGTQNNYSVLLNYAFTPRFNVYGGAMWSGVTGGLANGYNYATSTLDPMIGARFRF